MAQSKTEIQNRYDTKNCKHFSLKLNCKTDKDIIDKLENTNSSIQSYIKECIRKDIKAAEGKEGTTK